MPEPKDLTDNDHYKFFQNKECPFWMCHSGVKEEDFSCLYCYCPLIAYECVGPYEVYTDKHGNTRKDCSPCHLPHNGLIKSWKFIQKSLENPRLWDGSPQTPQRLRQAQEVEHPREGSHYGEP